MSAINNGGPAFPNVPDGAGDKWADWDKGMTLRDYFAAKALQGLCANPGGPFQANTQNGWALTNCNEDNVAGTAYSMADAMLRAREAKPL